MAVIVDTGDEFTTSANGSGRRVNDSILYDKSTTRVIYTVDQFIAGVNHTCDKNLKQLNLASLLKYT